MDWDSVQVPVLATINWQGQPRKVVLWANRNGFFYVLDRGTGKFLLGKAFVKQNWNVGFDEAGRPMKNPALDPKPMGGPYVEPGTQGGTNWYSPSFSPRTGLFYVSAWDNYGGPSSKGIIQEWKPGGKYSGNGRPPGQAAPGRAAAGRGAAGRGAGGRRGPGNPGLRTEDEGYGAIRAIDPLTGEKKWDFKMTDYTESGLLTTAADIIFGGDRDGTFVSLDARTGEMLWHTNLGGTVASGPVTYEVNGRQYVAICADNALYAFGLPD